MNDPKPCRPGCLCVCGTRLAIHRASYPECTFQADDEGHAVGCPNAEAGKADLRMTAAFVCVVCGSTLSGNDCPAHCWRHRDASCLPAPAPVEKAGVPWPDGVPTCGELSSDECNDRYFALRAEVERLKGVSRQQSEAIQRHQLAEISLSAELAQEKAAREKAEAERDQFETESEQKGADLMGCEGALKEAEARVKVLEKESADRDFSESYYGFLRDGYDPKEAETKARAVLAAKKESK